MKNRFEKGVQVNPIIGLLGAVFFFVMLFYIARFLFNLLGLIAPFLLIATFFINRSVIYNYIDMIKGLFSKSLVIGLVGTVLTIFGFPFVCAYLFGKALLIKKMDNVMEKVEERVKGKYVEYEEIEHVKEELPDQLELKTIKREKISKGNQYDELFNE